MRNQNTAGEDEMSTETMKPSYVPQMCNQEQGPLLQAALLLDGGKGGWGSREEWLHVGVVRAFGEYVVGVHDGHGSKPIHRSKECPTWVHALRVETPSRRSMLLVVVGDHDATDVYRLELQPDKHWEEDDSLAITAELAATTAAMQGLPLLVEVNNQLLDVSRPDMRTKVRMPGKLLLRTTAEQSGLRATRAGYLVWEVPDPAMWSIRGIQPISGSSTRCTVLVNVEGHEYGSRWDAPPQQRTYRVVLELQEGHEPDLADLHDAGKLGCGTTLGSHGDGRWVATETVEVGLLTQHTATDRWANDNKGRRERQPWQQVLARRYPRWVQAA